MKTQAHSDPHSSVHPPLWQNLSFMLLWVSTAAAGFGDRLIELVAMPLLGVTEGSAQASVIQARIYFFFFVPWLVICPIGGWLADTFPRKFVLFGCDIARGLILALAWYWIYSWKPHGTSHEIALDPIYHWRVDLILAMVGTFAAIFGPTRNAFVPQVVPYSQLQAANAIILAIGVVASLFGFVIGAPILDRWSVAAGLAIGCAIYIGSGTFFLLMKARPHEGEAIDKKSEIQRLLEAWTFCRQHRPILILILLTTLFWGAAQVFLAAMAAFCKDFYGVAPQNMVSSIAFLMFLLGVGMLSGSMIVSWINNTRESGWFAFIALILSAGAMLAMCVNRSYHVAAALSFLVGFFGSAAMICVATLMQSITPDYIRGRVFGVREVISTSLGVLVNLIIWQLPELQKIHPDVPTADHLMVPALFVTALILVFVGFWGVNYEMSHGPMPTTRANRLWHLVRFYTLFWHRLHWQGRESVPHQGPVILVCNYSSMVDPVLVQAGLPRRIRWILPREKMHSALSMLWSALEPKILEPGSRPMDQLKETIASVSSGEMICVFPEKTNSTDGSVQPLDPMIAMVALRSEATIVPTRILGSPGIRGFAAFLFRGKARVIYGRPFKADKNQKNDQIAQEIHRRLAALG